MQKSNFKKVLVFSIIISIIGSVIITIIPVLKANLTDGLVGYWNFNEGSGTIAYDKSGNGNDCTINGASWNTETPNNEGYALYFDGVDDYVFHNPFNIFPTTQISAIFWMKTSDTVQDGTPLSYASATVFNDFVICDYSNFKLSIGDQNAGGETGETGVSANDGIWHQIVITWKSFDGEVKVYKDSVVEYSGTLFTGGAITQGGFLAIGSEQDCLGGCWESNQYFKGVIDEIYIYNRVLSQEEIQYLYNLIYRVVFPKYQSFVKVHIVLLLPPNYEH